MKTMYTKEQKKNVLSLLQTGLKVKEIAEISGTDVKFVYNTKSRNKPAKIVEVSKEIKVIRKRENTTKRDLKICELFKAGKRQAEIAREMNLSSQVVHYTLNKYGISDPAKYARKAIGEIPSELLQPIVDWLTKNATIAAAEKMAEFARTLSA